MVEPTDPAERALAIRICRANAYLNPDTGERQTDQELSTRPWAKIYGELPYKKWIWMWNHGRQEWDTRVTVPTGDKP